LSNTPLTSTEVDSPKESLPSKNNVSPTTALASPSSELVNAASPADADIGATIKVKTNIRESILALIVLSGPDT
jgi:hypothetical protein